MSQSNVEFEISLDIAVTTSWGGEHDERIGIGGGGPGQYIYIMLRLWSYCHLVPIVFARNQLVFSLLYLYLLLKLTDASKIEIIKDMIV